MCVFLNPLKLHVHVYNRSSSSVGRRVIVYTATGFVAGTVAAVGGTVAYANYDTEFRKLADSYLPGFGEFCERSAVGWSKSCDATKQGWHKLKDMVLPESHSGIRTVDSKDIISGTTETTTKQVVDSGAKYDSTRDISSAEKETVKEMSGMPTSKGGAESSAVHTSKEGAESLSASDASKEGDSSNKPAAIDDRIIAAENDLQAAYREFSQWSDGFIESLENLAQSINTHNMQVLEATKTPKDEKQMEIIVGGLIVQPLPLIMMY